jgi:hypothetical protein
VDCTLLRSHMPVWNHEQCRHHTHLEFSIGTLYMYMDVVSPSISRRDAFLPVLRYYGPKHAKYTHYIVAC